MSDLERTRWYDLVKTVVVATIINENDLNLCECLLKRLLIESTKQ
jgi:hypothetical protein